MNWSFISVTAIFAVLLALRFRAIRRDPPVDRVIRNSENGD